MKGFVLFFVAFFAVSTATVYDEKSDAIKEIEKKFKEAKDLQASLLKEIASEMKNVNATAGEQDLLKQVVVRISETKKMFEEDADAVIRTAIVQGKPVAVIYCIRNVSDKIRVEIVELENSIREQIIAIKVRKYQKINFDDYAVNAIIKGLSELKTQSIEKINNAEGVISQLKKEAINRCDSALLLLGEIEVSISEPTLSKEYVKMKQKIDKTLKEARSRWALELESCLSQKLARRVR